MELIPYANMVGSIMYSMVCTGPDLAYAMSRVSRYMATPGKDHYHALRWIMKYLRGSVNLSLVYMSTRLTEERLVGYADANHGGCLDTGRSTTGYVFTLFKGCISWKASLHKVVAVSTTESEYMAAAEATKKAIWLKGLISEIKGKTEDVTVYGDNQSAIHLIKNPMFHERTKHIDIIYHFIRDVVAKGQMIVKKIDTDDNPADVLTKVLPGPKFKYCLDLIQVFDPGDQSKINL